MMKRYNIPERGPGKFISSDSLIADHTIQSLIAFIWFHSFLLYFITIYEDVFQGCLEPLIALVTLVVGFSIPMLKIHWHDKALYSTGEDPNDLVLEILEYDLKCNSHHNKT